MIKAFIFDLGNVLVAFDRYKIVDKLSSAAACSPVEFIGAYQESNIEDRLERGLLKDEELFAWFCGLGFKGGFEQFRLLWCDNFEEIKPVSRLFLSLKNRGKVLILSNTSRLHYEFLSNKFPFLKAADAAVLSYELGLRKPEPEIYKAALRAAGVEPEEAI
ncbi:MAG TPA: hypothetical protein PLL10_05680, partial [Elusimicrobiales bacterium]|nr:hypothetical protein [Elusimicrobiales bacterium]